MQNRQRGRHLKCRDRVRGALATVFRGFRKKAAFIRNVIVNELLSAMMTSTLSP